MSDEVKKKNNTKKSASTKSNSSKKSVTKKKSSSKSSKSATSKTVSRKSAPVKENKVEEKKVGVSEEIKEVSTKKKDNTFFEKFKKFISSYAFLYTVFAILLVCVVVLGCMVFVKQREAKKNESNIVVPILEDGNRSSFNIDLNELKSRGEYVLKVTNYRGDKINTESMDYSITIRNETGVKVKVTKDENNDDLIVDPEATIIEGIGFGAEEMESDVYHFVIDGDAKIEKDATISIEIATQKRSS